MALTSKYFHFGFISKRVRVWKSGPFLFTFGQKNLVMVIFNKLELVDDNRRLDIDIELDSEGDSYFGGVWLDYYANVTATDVRSPKALVVTSYDGTQHFEGSVHQSQLTIQNPGVTTFDKGLFYLIVEVFTPREDPEEDPIRTVELAAIPDYNWLYRAGMNVIVGYSTKHFINHCVLPDSLEQFVLFYHSLLFAIEAKDIDMINTLWGRGVGTGDNVPASPCNCG